MAPSRGRPLRVVLADPPVGEEFYAYYHPSMGILYLLGALQARFARQDVEVHYLHGFGSLRDHLRTLADLAPDVYGISFKSPLAQLAYRTTRAVRERFPDLNIIAGGAHPTAMPEEVMRSAPIDACLRGECEDSFVRAVENTVGGRMRFGHVPGATYCANGELVANPVPPFITDLDSLPRPAWDMTDLKRFTGMPYMRRHPYAGVTVSRGCPYQCTFCSEPIWKIHGRPSYRARSPQEIAAEVDDLYRRGVREIRLWCEELNADPVWATDLLERLAALKHGDLYFSANVRGDTIPADLAQAMQAANLWLVNMGMESRSNRSLSGIRKQITVEQVENSCRVLANRGIKVLGYFQLFLAWEEDGRLCWETDREARNSIRWALSLHRRGLMHFMGTTVSTPRPATPLWDLARRHSLMKAVISDPFLYQAEGMNLPGLSPLRVKGALLQAYLAKAWIGIHSGHINHRVTLQYSVRALRRLLGV